MHMLKEELIIYIEREYHVEPDHPFPKDFESAVFRHRENQKWFALIMRVGRDKLGLYGEGMIDIVNVKTEPEMAASLAGGGGIYPAYHMNKAHWVTVLLDGSAPDNTVKNLVDISFSLTAPKKR